MSAAIAPDPGWVDARNAAKILGVPGARNVQRLARSGLIATRELPGVRAKYSRADVERLAADGARAPKPPFDDLFDYQPRPGEDGKLVFALGRYVSQRNRRREGGSSPEVNAKTLGFGGALDILTYIGELTLCHVNRVLDWDPDSLIKALDGPDRGEDAEWTEGAVSRFWEALARFQAEGPGTDGQQGGCLVNHPR